MAVALAFAAWKSRRDEWVKWSLAAAFVTVSAVVLLGSTGPVLSQPIAAAIVLRIDARRYVIGRIFGVVLFLAAFVGSIPLGITPLLIVAFLPFLTVTLADRYVARRHASRSG